MNKRVLWCDLSLFFLQELLLLLLSNIIPETHAKTIDYFILGFEFLCIIIVSVFMIKSIKNTMISIIDVIVTFTLVFISFFVYFIILNNHSIFNGAKGFVFLGFTMTIGWYGLEYLSCFFYSKSNSLIGQNNNTNKLYMAFSILLEKAAIITAIANIIITFVIAINN